VIQLPPTDPSPKPESREARWTRSSLASLLFFAIFALSSASQTPSPAVALARRVDEHYNRLHTLKASFEEQYDGLGMHRAESGVMMLQKPGRMRWDYRTTPGKLFVLDGKFAWFYSPGATQVQRIPASRLDDLRSPLRFLLGHTKLETELVNLSLKPDPSGSTILTGVPKGQEKRIAKLTLDIAPDGAIQGITIEELDGARTQFHFTSEQANPTLPGSAFHYTAPPGIPVVDSLPPV
jgi:outer membrane lipoprotein carrier protein